MKLFATCILSLAFVPASAIAQDARQSESVERPFVSGGSARLDLTAGAYIVRRGSDDRIRVTWRTRNADQLTKVRVTADVRGNEARIVTTGVARDTRIIIELPARTDLHLRMSAGDLEIGGLEGNKDIRLRAGELDIDIGDARQYGDVDAYVTVGDLRARPFGVSTGGLFRSFTREGAGRYSLRVRLWAGELTMFSREGADARR